MPAAKQRRDHAIFRAPCAISAVAQGLEIVTGVAMEPHCVPAYCTWRCRPRSFPVRFALDLAFWIGVALLAAMLALIGAEQ